jgi:hypothetical protein
VNFLHMVSSSGFVEVFVMNGSELFMCGFHLCVLRECLELTNVNFLHLVSSSGFVEVFTMNGSELFMCGFHLCVLRECLELTNVNFLHLGSSSGVVEVFAVSESELFMCGFPSWCTEGVFGVNERQLSSFGVSFGFRGSVCNER